MEKRVRGDPESGNAAHDMFASELLPGEVIEWSGRPNPAVIFHPQDWWAIPFSLVWGGVYILWLVRDSGLKDFPSMLDNGSSQWFQFVLAAAFVVIGQYAIWGRFLYNRWRKKRTYYVLTDRRALVIYRGLGSGSATSAYFEHMPMIDKRVRDDNIGTISFGGPVMGEFRSDTNHGLSPSRMLTTPIPSMEPQSLRTAALATDCVLRAPRVLSCETGTKCSHAGSFAAVITRPPGTLRQPS